MRVLYTVLWFLNIHLTSVDLRLPQSVFFFTFLYFKERSTLLKTVTISIFFRYCHAFNKINYLMSEYWKSSSWYWLKKKKTNLFLDECDISWIKKNHLLDYPRADVNCLIYGYFFSFGFHHSMITLKHVFLIQFFFLNLSPYSYSCCFTCEPLPFVVVVNVHQFEMKIIQNLGKVFLKN